jgi:hypothetical protein
VHPPRHVMADQLSSLAVLRGRGKEPQQ